MTSCKKKESRALNSNTLEVQAEPDVSREATMAKLAVEPCMTAAAVSSAYSGVFGDVDLACLHEALVDKALRVHGGNMREVESTLVAQAAALNSIFTSLARRADKQQYLPQFEAYMKLGLRAQNQCRMTLETLATIKNPPVVFAKQANIANNQQVNNGDAVPVARAGETGNRPNEQSRIGHDKGQSLDGGTLQDAIGSRAPLETVAAVNRPQDGEG